MDKEEVKDIRHDEVTANIYNNKYVWIFGAIILLVVGWFSLKVLFTPPEDYKVTLIDAPKEVTGGNTATFTWKITGSSTTINHTAVYLGNTSNPGEFGLDVKPEGTKYTDYVRDFADGKYDIPLQFIGNIKLDTPGQYFYRVQATVRDKNYWTDEYSLEVKPQVHKVSLIDPVKEAKAGAMIPFTWRVDGPPLTINHTSVHYGLVSTPGELGRDVKPADTKYVDLVKDFASGKYNIPLQFVGNARIEVSGTYYYRAHAVIDGKNYWTDEQVMEVR